MHSVKYLFPQWLPIYCFPKVTSSQSYYTFSLVVVLTLFLNNLFITLNSLCLMLIIILNGLQLTYFQPILYTLSVLLIIFGCLARLTSLGTNISVEKDWVVVIAHKDKRSLACKPSGMFI